MITQMQPFEEVVNLPAVFVLASGKVLVVSNKQDLELVPKLTAYESVCVATSPTPNVHVYQEVRRP